ncbi:uncharacterized protein PV09_06180 [Verruconis gallopava]|uniref:Short-chain dehydrogenase n=1 Tax=Verruconis gallopava TaxID=253628 RepID=A0A0D2A6J8_9PEZI|nr:uncharacterized protein PV09_06180 [Verruconis gallopava]KIW02358.1 hypothetical protein PV09_06180 [Verruconis gallopava]
MSNRVLFILGAGPKIGFSVAQAFAANGYKVALASRSIEDGMREDGLFGVNLDLTKPEMVESAFEKVEKQFGVPSVVVYNAALRNALEADDPLSGIDLDQVQQEWAVNVTSALFSAKYAVRGFKRLPESASKTFIFTGNKLNTFISPAVTTFAMGKTAIAQLIRNASVAYRKQGIKFYYADERRPDGGPVVPVSGSAAAVAYTKLAEEKEQGPWDYTFIDGIGYHDFKETAA